MIKIQIGAGGNELSSKGWIDTDLEPRPGHPNIAMMDACKTWPYADASVDYIFSEHQIEHIVYDEGLKMLVECFRVLKSGGKIRITTPDLAWLVHLHRDPLSDLEKRYLDMQHKSWRSAKYVQRPTPAFMINFMMRMGGENGGHVFIYDEDTLSFALRSVGFVDVKPFKIMESNDENLRGLECEWRMAPGFLQLESFTLEATKL